MHLSCTTVSTCIMYKIKKAIHLSVCHLVYDVMPSNRSIRKRAVLKKICKDAYPQPCIEEEMLPLHVKGDTE